MKQKLIVRCGFAICLAEETTNYDDDATRKTVKQTKSYNFSSDLKITVLYLDFYICDNLKYFYSFNLSVNSQDIRIQIVRRFIPRDVNKGTFGGHNRRSASLIYTMIAKDHFIYLLQADVDVVNLCPLILTVIVISEQVDPSETLHQPRILTLCRLFRLMENSIINIYSFLIASCHQTLSYCFLCLFPFQLGIVNNHHCSLQLSLKTHTHLKRLYVTVIMSFVMFR